MAEQRIDLSRWNRRPHFEYFDGLSHPWLDICADVDVTLPWAICQRPGGPSFFAASLFLALGAVNEVEELRMRVRGDEVVVHDLVHAGATILRDDGTFGFGFIDADSDFAAFETAAAAEVERVRVQTKELVDREVDDLIHFSIVPWISFTGVGHPRRRGAADSIPKIVLGRCTRQNSRWSLPVAVSAHHGLVDALHVARFLDAFSARCASAEEWLGASS